MDKLELSKTSHADSAASTFSAASKSISTRKLSRLRPRWHPVGYPWRTNLILVPCPLLTPRPSRSSPPSKLCPISFWKPVSKLISLTAATIDSWDFLNAKKFAETQLLLPLGPCIAFAGRNDHQRIWDTLDKIRAEAPGYGFAPRRGHEGYRAHRRLLGGQPRVPQVAFKPEWTRHKKSAPFKGNDAMFEVLPIGAIMFPGSGIVENLADKGRKVGIPMWRAPQRRLDPIRVRPYLLGAPNRPRGLNG